MTGSIQLKDSLVLEFYKENKDLKDEAGFREKITNVAVRNLKIGLTLAVIGGLLILSPYILPIVGIAVPALLVTSKLVIAAVAGISIGATMSGSSICTIAKTYNLKRKLESSNRNIANLEEVYSETYEPPKRKSLTEMRGVIDEQTPLLEDALKGNFVKAFPEMRDPVSESIYEIFNCSYQGYKPNTSEIGISPIVINTERSIDQFNLPSQRPKPSTQEQDKKKDQISNELRTLLGLKSNSNVKVTPGIVPASRSFTVG